MRNGPRSWFAQLRALFLNKRKKDSSSELLTVAEAMGRSRNLPKLSNLICHVLARHFHASHLTLFLKDGHRPGFTAVASRGRAKESTLSLEEVDPLITLFYDRGYPIVRADLRADPKVSEPLSQVIQTLDRFDAAFCVPAFLEKKLKCFFMVGPPPPGNSYRKQDVEVFSLLAIQAALAIENAQAYEELRNTRDQLLEMERLSTIGKFAAGMAHEIKNPLQSILTFFQYLPEKRNDPDFMGRFASVAQQEADRINQLVRELMTYTYLRPPKFQPLQIDQLIDNVLDLLENDLVKHSIEVRKGYSPNPMTAEADQNQMKQVFLNLFMNAIEAMASIKKESHRLEIVVFPDGETMVVKVRDTGPGIPSHLLPTIFSRPLTTLQTTKEKGFGLGLYIVYQILQAHSAGIRVESREGLDTTMTLTLPKKQPTATASSTGTSPSKTEEKGKSAKGSQNQP